MTYLALLLMLAAPAAAQDRQLGVGVLLRHFDLPDGRVTVVEVELGPNRLQIMAAGSTWLFSDSAVGRRCDELSPPADTQPAKARLECRRDEALQIQKLNPADQSLLLGQYLAMSGAIAVLSGGYLESFAPPRALGYVAVDGVELNRSHRSWLTSAVVCQRGVEVVIDLIESVDLTGFDSCLQAGPLIVATGLSRYGGSEDVTAAERKLIGSRQEQAFVCIDGEGMVLLGISEPTTLEMIADFAAGELGCRQAMRLSGHITAGLATHLGTFGYNEIPLHNAIGIMPTAYR